MSDIDCTLTPPVRTVIPLDIVLDTDAVGVNTGTVELTQPLNPPITTTVPLNIDYDPDCIGLASGVVELTAPLTDYTIDLGFISDTSGLSGVVELTAPINDLTIDVDAGRGEVGPQGETGPEGPQGDPGVGIVNHGDDPNFPRPDDPDPVVWEGTVLPNNWLEDDIWINPEVATTPIYAGSILVQDPSGLFDKATVEDVLAELYTNGPAPVPDPNDGSESDVSGGFSGIFDGGGPATDHSANVKIDFGGVT